MNHIADEEQPRTVTARRQGLQHRPRRLKINRVGVNGYSVTLVRVNILVCTNMHLKGQRGEGCDTILAGEIAHSAQNILRRQQGVCDSLYVLRCL